MIKSPLARTSAAVIMKRYVLLYGLIGGLLIGALRWMEYRFLVLEHSLDLYGGLVALIFAGLGIWLGLRLTRPRPAVLIKEVRVWVNDSGPFQSDLQKLEELGITARELEILQLIAEGLSNREIAERIFVSENTVKTHSSRVFDKLGAKRRTQAVQIAKASGLIP